MQTVAHVGDPALANTLRQLWGAAVESGDVRIRTTGRATPGWEPVRHFDVFPSTSRARMIMERGRSATTAKALLAYQGLRPRRLQAARLATTAAAGARAAGGRPAFVLEHATRAAGAPEPLTAVGERLGRPVLAHVGVRTGANAKATAQLFSPSGTPVGYAKFAWNPLTSGYVLTEADRLQELDGQTGGMRVPLVLARGETFGQPYLVTAPLPRGVRRLSRPEDLGVAELATVSPLDRRAPAHTSGALLGMREHAEQLRQHAVVRDAAAALAQTVGGLMGLEVSVPIARFDHGDLVPWNTCRSREGEVWAWDWESSITDVVAGTDALHWFVHSVHGPSPSDLAAATTDAFTRAAPTFHALGMTPAAQHVATAAFALATVERACALAASHDTWSRNRIGADDVARLLTLAQHHIDSAAR